jgi:hypothetical protein
VLTELSLDQAALQPLLPPALALEAAESRALATIAQAAQLPPPPQTAVRAATDQPARARDARPAATPARARARCAPTSRDRATHELRRLPPPRSRAPSLSPRPAFCLLCLSRAPSLSPRPAFCLSRAQATDAAPAGKPAAAAAKAVAAPTKGAADKGAPPEARALVLRYVALLRARSSVRIDPDSDEALLEQAHAALVAGCAQYATGCVLPPLPAPSDMTVEALAFVPGSICVQWHAPVRARARAPRRAPRARRGEGKLALRSTLLA